MSDKKDEEKEVVERIAINARKALEIIRKHKGDTKESKGEER